MYRIITILSIALITLLATACGSQQNSEQSYTLWVNSHTTPCQGVAPMDCLQTHKGKAEPQDSEWQLFYSTIEGFTFEPGYRYQLSVTERQLAPKDVQADASSSTYHLVEVLQKIADASNQLTDIWALQALNGEEISTSENTINQHPVLELDIGNKRFSGNDSCNQIFGGIETLTDEKITFGPAASTKMACPDMTLADSFYNALEATSSYKREGLLLYFYNQQGKEVLRFRKVD
ncbi:DUF4377 domain-containing protein [Porticoccus sp. W117]|uniref:DUF4377 domain-containing protein n=1 Tax=Porticoccus sp. W117 TaxID=3054777 RepID=UPI002599168F|nr:DUF4377 domain-containing protein [Porticoccus sp. W117]MDM3870706.1 DUF4377 domain-containing protein [Porticoccus sp. W117]